EWTRGDDGAAGKTWNPIVGCTIVSPGCTNCYAMRMADRINRMTPERHYDGLTKVVNGNPVWTGKIAKAPPHIFTAPLHWRKPARIFVNSMSDLFHESVPTGLISYVFDIMEKANHHTYQILTKRSDSMAKYLSNRYGHDMAPSHIWLGVSVENQSTDFRISDLRSAHAAVKFLSLEPLLGPLPDLNLDGIDWVIVGGESGPSARPMNPDWARDIRDQCLSAGAPFFFKQHGGANKKAAGRELDGRTWDEMPQMKEGFKQ
ncbi:MAG: phage Gp37/Gp68 family protein, partial [Alphaproteobacteria bacterium]